jgi:hypothetical protein
MGGLRTRPRPRAQNENAGHRGRNGAGAGSETSPEIWPIPPAKQALEARDVACGIDAANESFGAWEVGQEVGRLSVAVGRLADVVVALVRECER